MPKIKKKRHGFAIDMTPLVDVTFLLLTFFMFTAKFKNESESEQKFQIKRPTALEDTSKVPEKDAAFIKIGIDTLSGDTSYYYQIINEKQRNDVYDRLNFKNENQRKLQLKVGQQPEQVELLGRLIAETRRANPKTKFSIDCDRRIRYGTVETLIDEMRKYGATSFSFVTEKKGS